MKILEGIAALSELPETVRGRYATVYLAVGSLRYGGTLHHMLVGSIFAGGALGRDMELREVEGLKLASSGKGTVLGELYYVSPAALRELDERLSAYGAVRRAVVAGFKPLSLTVETHMLTEPQGSKAADEQTARLLVALPPLLPPPAQPMATYTVVLNGVKPCNGGEAFCPQPGTRWEAPVADVFLPLGILEEWARANGVVLVQMAARTIYGLAVFPLVPLRRSQASEAQRVQAPLPRG